MLLIDLNDILRQFVNSRLKLQKKPIISDRLSLPLQTKDATILR